MFTNTEQMFAIKLLHYLVINWMVTSILHMQDTTLVLHNKHAVIQNLIAQYFFVLNLKFISTSSIQYFSSLYDICLAKNGNYARKLCNSILQAHKWVAVGFT